MAEKIRLQKILAENGIASRRKSEEIIASGRVTVNGVRAKVGDKADPDRDRILIDGEPFLSGKEKNTYIMLHKPRGFVTTMNDEMGRKCVAQLVEDVGIRVFPVGRLDRYSEGLLLFTNDGEFANMMMHPSMHVSKTYRVTVREKVNENQLTALASGIMIDGKKTLPADIKVLLTEPDRTVMQIVLREGRNRQIRKMCEESGLTVIRLKRTSFGTVKLGMLQPGKWRELEKEEVASLKRLAQKAAKANQNNNRRR